MAFCHAGGGVAQGASYRVTIPTRLANDNGKSSRTPLKGNLGPYKSFCWLSSRNVSVLWYEREADLFGAELLIPEFLFHRNRKEFPLGLEGVKGLAEVFETSLTAMGIRYATLCTQPVTVVVREGNRILYAVLSKPFASEFGVESRRAARSRDLPAESATQRLNADGRSSQRSGALCTRISGSRMPRGNSRKK